MSKYVAAIDQGTTSTRCILLDHYGNILAADQKEHQQICPRPGWVEHDALEIWEHTQRVVRGALDKSGGDVADIAAIGITNQRETTLIWERATGRPVYNAIVWQDTRTDAICNELANALGDSLGWDGAQKNAEVMRTLEILADRHGVRLEHEK